MKAAKILLEFHKHFTNDLILCDPRLQHGTSGASIDRDYTSSSSPNSGRHPAFRALRRLISIDCALTCQAQKYTFSFAAGRSAYNKTPPEKQMFSSLTDPLMPSHYMPAKIGMPIEC